MKTSTVFSTTNRLQTQQGITSSLLMTFMLFIITGHVFAQSGPGVTIRFANPEFFPADETYCVDVEFIADTDDVELFGMNARFFVDHNLFDLLGFDDFQGGYGLAADGIGVVTSTGDGNFFGFEGDALFINQAIEKVDENAPVFLLAQNEWTYLFKVCFTLKDEDLLGLDLFCPSIVWDLRQGKDKGFPAGSDGLVMTVVSDGNGGCIMASEDVVQFNWLYGDPAGSYGGPETDPDNLACTSTKSIPLNWWSMGALLAGMLLFMAYRYKYGTNKAV